MYFLSSLIIEKYEKNPFLENWQSLRLNTVAYLLNKVKTMQSGNKYNLNTKGTFAWKDFKPNTLFKVLSSFSWAPTVLTKNDFWDIKNKKRL